MKTRQRCEFDLICEAFLSGNSISCVVVSDEHHWMESMSRAAETPRDTFTFFLQDLDKERKT